ncbi:hypothetical protein GCM10010517_37940 [Streptosporangium fragile]|uniref:Uncharacterized protein n=1 Tax=Streptosporangium fragile TaxID=46186 RepID=A0ABN3W0C9_9ACTN
MGRKFKLGVVVAGVGVVIELAGVLGMATIWPFPWWGTPMLVAGGITMAAGIVMATAITQADMVRGMMSGLDAGQPGGGFGGRTGGGSGGKAGGGLFAMVNDMVRGNDDLLDGGVPATAVVVSMRDTGMTVNDMPMVAFELEVRGEGTAPYRVPHRETLPRLLVGAVLPGTLLAVMVDPVNPNRLTVDWGAFPDQAGPRATEYLSAADLIARGLPGTATVEGTFSTDGMTAENGDPIIGFALRVTPGTGGAPYQVRIGHRVPPAHLHRAVPGTRLPVRIAPEDPEKVAVDWDAAAAADLRGSV